MDEEADQGKIWSSGESRRTVPTWVKSECVRGPQPKGCDWREVRVIAFERELGVKITNWRCRFRKRAGESSFRRMSNYYFGK